MTLNLDDKMELERVPGTSELCIISRVQGKWRHRYSEAFINIFQSQLIGAFEDQKPINLQLEHALPTRMVTTLL